MKIKTFSIIALLSIGLLSCSEDGGGVDPAEKGAVYLNVTVSVPSSVGTKSSTNPDGTSTSGTENGTEAESKVSSITVIAVNNAGSVVATSGIAGIATEMKPNPSTNYDGSAVRYETKTIPVSGLTVGSQYKFYVFTNTAINSIITDFPAGSFDETKAISIASTDITTSGIAKDNDFFMTNAEPATFQTVQTSATNPNTPLTLEIKVERAAARFDYTVNSANLFEVYSENANDKISVKLDQYAFVNVHKSFYYFKRVSDTGTNASWVLGANETSVNYVVDTDYASKVGAPTQTPGFFLNPLKPAAASPAVTYLNLPTSDSKLGYVTENTIPGASNQYNGYTTGLVFRGELVFAGTLQPVTGTNIYIYGGKYYKDWNTLYTAISAYYNDLNAAETHADNTTAKLADYGIKRISPTGGKYYVYYIYWNRHNDNLDATIMGPMEFAVVRNNLYRLRIESISQFGHPNDPLNPPTNPDPDPDDPDPKNPDESPSLYMKVKVEVLPWVLRLNNIKF